MNHQWVDEKGSWSSSGPAKADEENFPMWNAGVMLAQQQENFPMWNAGVMLAQQQQSSSSSGPAQKADEVNFQVQGQNYSVFLGKCTGAEGNFCGVGGIVDGKVPGQMPQFVEVINDPSLSGAHPMYERPRVVEGPYAPIKTKKGQKVLTTIRPMTRKEPAGQSTKISKSGSSPPTAKKLRKSIEKVVKFPNKLT